MSEAISLAKFDEEEKDVVLSDGRLAYLICPTHTWYSVVKGALCAPCAWESRAAGNKKYLEEVSIKSEKTRELVSYARAANRSS